MQAAVDALRPGTWAGLGTVPSIKIAAAALAVAGFCAAGIYASMLGAGTDRDSIRVIWAAHQILGGHYAPSRSWGFPLHEAICAVLLAAGGPFAVNLASVAAIGAGIWMAACIAPPARAWLAVVALCGSPLLLCNAGVAIDFGWDFSAGMATLCAALQLQRKAGAWPLSLFGAAVLALLLLRPDNGLFVTAIIMAMPAKNGVRYRAACVTAGAGLAAAGAYIGLAGPHALLTAIPMRGTWPGHLARAAILASAVLGPGGVMALVLLAAHRARGPAVTVLAFALPLYALRFAALPDQADYLILPVALLTLAAATALPYRLAVACCCAIIAPALITVSLLERSPDNGALRLHVALQQGAVAQEWAARCFSAAMDSPEAAAAVSARTQGLPRLTHALYLPAFMTPEGDTVIGAEHMSRIDRAQFRALWVCDAPLGPGIGWRGWQAPAGTQAARGAFTCRPAQDSASF